MNHDLMGSLKESITTNTQSITIVTNNLSSKVEQAGGNIKLAIKDLSDAINTFSKSSDKQSQRMYWLTWALVGTGVLNVIAIIFQTYHH